MKYFVLTNNKMVNDDLELIKKYKIDHIEFLEEASIDEIFIKARDYVHLGYSILTHPLSGSVKPRETPFKSVCISLEKGELNTESLDIIEKAIILTQNFKKKKDGYEKVSEKIINDFRLIDYCLTVSGCQGINNC